MLFGCGETNRGLGKPIDAATYTAEYIAVATAIGKVGPHLQGLEAIEFYELSEKQLNSHCGAGIPGCAYLPEEGLNGVVFLPPAMGPCDTLPKVNRYMSDLVMHEIAHAMGYKHGPEMSEVLGEAWLVYLKGSPCEDAANMYLAPEDRPRTLAAKALLSEKHTWVSLHPNTHALSGVATLSKVGPALWEWVLMTEGAVLHAHGGFQGSLEDAKEVVESVAREYTFVE